MRLVGFILLLLVPFAAFAAPVTFDVTPTFAPPSGIVDGYRAYRDCDLAAQTSATLIGPSISGQPFRMRSSACSSYERQASPVNK